MPHNSTNVGEILAGANILYKRRVIRTVEGLAKANRLKHQDLLDAMRANRDADIQTVIRDLCREKGVRVNAML